MTALRRPAIGLGVLLTAILLVWGGIGFLGPLPYGTSVTVTATQPVTPTQDPSRPDVPCPGNQPGPVHYYANEPLAAQYNDFGVPLAEGLDPLYEPASTPRPDTDRVVRETWFRLCHDPALTRAVVAAAFPTWPGLHILFNWRAALQLLNQGNWSLATMAYHAVAPTPWTMSMVASPSGGPPRTLIVHAPWQGWYLVVRFGDHDVLLRPGCGDQPVLDMRGYHALLTARFPSA